MDLETVSTAVNEWKHILCNKYHIPAPPIYLTDQITNFKLDKSLSGFCAKDSSSEQFFIALRPNDDVKSLKCTFFHEFRHYWQKLQTSNIKISHWLGWAKNNQIRFGKDAYFFSPVELDAIRFANSESTKDDLSVFEACRQFSKVGQELRNNQHVASELAHREGFHLVKEDTLLRLVNLGMVLEKAFYQWLSLCNRKR